MRMRALLAFAASLFLSTSLTAQQPPSPTTLQDLRDRYRPLLLFAAKPEDPALLVQLRKLKDSAVELAQRDVVVIAVPFDTPSPTAISLTTADTIATRRRFHVTAEDFTVILIGKDGGEKLRSKNPVSFDHLREAIDAMPMRKDEMRSQHRP